MLSKGFRDEEQEKLNEVFSSGMAIEFVPGLWEKEQRKLIDSYLQKNLETTLDELETVTTKSMLENLKSHNLSFTNYENFADLLLKVAPFEEEKNQKELAKKALAIYEFAQQESKTFSFALIQKINATKAKI